MNCAAAGKVRGLTSNDVDSSAAQTFLTNVEGSIIHYGDGTGFFADKMFNKGPSYLSVAVMSESLVVEGNLGETSPHLTYPVAAIYPKEGTYYSDRTCATLQGSWMTPAKKVAWNGELRRVDVMLILDRSASMDDMIGGASKLQAARQGLKQFVTLLSGSDSVGLAVFGETADVVPPVSQLGPKRQGLLTRVDDIVSDGSTQLFDTINEQAQALQSQPTPDIKAGVVLSGGSGNRSTLTIDQFVNAISASGENAGNAVKVFAIAYGSDAGASGLTKIASATGGQERSTPGRHRTSRRSLSRSASSFRSMA